jgi:hypothetical protein
MTDIRRMNAQCIKVMTIKELLAQETSGPSDPLWDYAKYVFDVAAKEPRSILCGLDSVYESLEDFCTLKGIEPSPLCAFIFKSRGGGFLSQAKLPRYHRKEWNELFPDPLRMTYSELPEALVEYKRFLEERNARFDWEALSFLKEYEGSEDSDDSEDS